MKIALLFAGQPRFVEEVYPLIKQNVIGDYDVDVFSFLWEMESDKAYKYGGDGGWKNQRISENAIDIVPMCAPTSTTIESGVMNALAASITYLLRTLPSERYPTSPWTPSIFPPR